MAALVPALSVTQLWLIAALLSVCFVVLSFVLYTAWVCHRFLPTMARVFEETPIFQPPDDPPIPDAEEVRFQTADGLTLCGSWLPGRGERHRGTIVFCHEFLSNRWSCRPYCEPLRDHGFDIFTFDFRNHGSSAALPGYQPMQWASAHEVRDLRAAIEHVRARRREASELIGLVGVSRGGSAAILTAPDEPCVRAVVTDGAFPTHRTQLSYMLRWAGIYAGHLLVYRLTPVWYFAMLSALARQSGARRHGCRFLKVEAAIRRLAPRPLLMIHGEKDSYIVPDIARQLFDCAREPKEFWLVPDAKHNAAVQVAGAGYSQRLLEFLCAAP